MRELGLQNYVEWLITYYGVLNLTSFCLYGFDKLAAKRKWYRISELTLHFVTFLGGWFGALLGQKIWHHKTKKRHFQIIFWLIVIAHFSLLVEFCILVQEK